MMFAHQSHTSPTPAYLHLSNGVTLPGEAIGASTPTQGELVFTTGMVGYSQALTDPSYFGQILVFTYPLQGNYGVPHPIQHLSSEKQTLSLPSAFESSRIRASGVVVSHPSRAAFHWSSNQTLHEWLRKEGIPGIAGVDTRRLTQIIRNSSNLRASLSLSPNPQRQILDQSSILLPYVSSPERKTLGKGKKRIALIDCGVKANILRMLLDQGCEIDLLPWDTNLSSIDCSGWLISNGPGDPQATGDLVHRVKQLIEQDQPIFGICLGYQLLALAAGAKTQKLKFGHRGHNHSVQLIGTQRGFMTSQNHGYIVLEETLPGNWEPWFRHLNDGTLEGIKHTQKPIRGVQFHPEAAAGPQDTAWILEDFIKELK